MQPSDKVPKSSLFSKLCRIQQYDVLRTLLGDAKVCRPCRSCLAVYKYDTTTAHTVRTVVYNPSTTLFRADSSDSIPYFSFHALRLL